MDFLNFFGFREDPFKLTPDPAYFYPSSSHNEGLLLMDYSTEQKEGFLLIIGDPGTGKTTLLNVFLEKWKLKAEIAIILTPRLSPEEFLISVVEDLNINLENKNKNEIIKALRDFMIQKSLEDKRVIIVVDEAQNLPDETLEELRLLSNLETDKDKLLQIILIGQPELESRLTTEKLRQLNQRITTRTHLGHLNHEETLDYINHRLIKAGKRNLKIDKRAGKLTYKLSNGIPRLINMLVSRALMVAYLEESMVISQRHIIHAAKSLNHSDLKTREHNKSIPIYTGISLILLTIIGYVYVQNKFTGHHRIAETQTTMDKQIEKTTEYIEQKDNPHKSYITPVGKMKAGLDFRKEPEGVSNKDITEGNLKIGGEPEQTSASQYITVKVDVVHIREMPSLASKIVGCSYKGNQFVVLDESLDESNRVWYQILYKDKKRWISQKVVE